tara:strand:- start:2354 stop:2794 length:441 start_codon:yes stop_codon:yes gene_type:complete
MQLIIVKAPIDINVELIKKLKSKASSIDYDISYIMSKYINYDIENVDISEELSEKDLFKLKDESLKTHKAAISHLIEAIDEIIFPMISISSRIGSNIGRDDVVYFDIGCDKYIAAARRDGYHYSKTESVAYEYLLSLNLSGVLEKI